MGEASSRPAFLDEFERKLAAALVQHAALAQQADARRTSFGSARSSDVNVEVASSPSLGESIASPSMGEEQALDVEPLEPLGETRERRAQSSAARLSSPQDDNAHDAAKALAAGGTTDVHATQPARLSDLAETSSADRAVQSPIEPSASSVTHEAPPPVSPSLPRGNGNGPTQKIGAAPGPVDSKAPDYRRRSILAKSTHRWQTRSRWPSNLPTFARVRLLR